MPSPYSSIQNYSETSKHVKKIAPGDICLRRCVLCAKGHLVVSIISSKQQAQLLPWFLIHNLPGMSSIYPSSPPGWSRCEVCGRTSTTTTSPASSSSSSSPSYLRFPPGWSWWEGGRWRRRLVAGRQGSRPWKYDIYYEHLYIFISYYNIYAAYEFQFNFGQPASLARH